MSSERITAAELERSKRARIIAKNWLEAESTRLKLAGLDPELEGDGTPGVQMRPSKFGRPSALERVKEARLSGLEIKEFSRGLGDESSSSKSSSHVSPGDIAASKGRIIESLAKAGKSPSEIQEYLEKISPQLDVFALTSDPAVQAVLFSKVMGNSGAQSLGLKDVVETIRLVNDMKGPQQQNVTELVAAMGSMFQSGVQAASKNNGDPMAAFNSAVQFITPIMDRQTETVKASFENQLSMLRTELQSKDPSTFFDKMKSFAETMGWHPGGSEDIEVLQRRLDIADRDNQRTFEWNKMRYETDMKMREEAAKDKRQAALLNGVIGTAKEAFQSPVIRELGKNVGSKLGVRENPLAKAQTAAAQNQLANPTDVPYQFQCPKCGTINQFSSKELTLIQEKGGKWVCPKCASPYELGKL